MRKNLYLTFLGLFFVGMTLTSCNKCVTCECDGIATEEICESDAANDAEYDAAIDALEALGCTCN